MKKFDQFCGHLAVLERAREQDLENEFIVSGIIDKFFIQFELGWKTLKDLLAHEGVAAAKTGSPRQIIKEAYRLYDCMDEETWLDMLAQRNDMAHLYDSEAAGRLMRRVLEVYIPAFQRLRDGLRASYGETLSKI